MPQDTEWAIDDERSFPDNVILLQTRLEVLAKKKGPGKRPRLQFCMRCRPQLIRGGLGQHAKKKVAERITPHKIEYR
jgi:hypothetical protein